MKHLLARLSLAALAAVAGCAQTTPPVTREIRTESDQTNADRRAQVRLELASAYLGRGQAATALDEVKLALAARPEMPEAFNVRGLAYATLGEPKLAEESFLRALQLRSGDADTLHNYGWFLCQQGRFAEAEQHFNAALAQPRYRDSQRTLLGQGVCQARAGQWAEAERTLLRSYELDPASPTTAFNLSEVLLRRGELDRARFYIKRVNGVPELSNAQTLWLAARIERRAGDSLALRDFGRQLRERFPQSPETLLLEQGRFDE